MANFNTFPHMNADNLNLDWLLEQYATFNDRIAQILQHFDDTVLQMQQQNQQYKNEMLALFNNYKNYVDAKIASINNAIEQVSDNVADFVADHMEEWQLEAMTPAGGGVIIGDYDPEQITTGQTLNNIIVNNKKMVLGNNLISVHDLGKTANVSFDHYSDTGIGYGRLYIGCNLSDFMNANQLNALVDAVGGNIENVENCNVYIPRLSDYNSALEGWMPILENAFLLLNGSTINDIKLALNYHIFDFSGTLPNPSTHPYMEWNMDIFAPHIL